MHLAVDVLSCCLFLSSESPFFTPSCSSSLVDMLPKVETRVVLVGEAGRNEALLKTLQVLHNSVISAGHRAPSVSPLKFGCSSLR